MGLRPRQQQQVTFVVRPVESEELDPGVDQHPAPARCAPRGRALNRKVEAGFRVQPGAGFWVEVFHQVGHGCRCTAAGIGPATKAANQQRPAEHRPLANLENGHRLYSRASPAKAADAEQVE
ncbi:MAG: hypothetical protein KatS3mg061_0839 [Dehalococcoidia bacterium]|nr:MAG: hypothetical protein KatS3mg061_0839 [Dehalococcoidia bacterium]